MLVTPKNFGVAPHDLRQLLAYFTRLFGGSNRWRDVNPKHFKKKTVSCGISKINNPPTVSTNIFVPSDVCGFVCSEGWRWFFRPLTRFLPTEK